MAPLLQVGNLHAYYGKSHVLHGVYFDVAAGEIVALLGRNGSGRSTTAKAIMGLVDTQGAIAWKGQPLAGLKPYEIAHRGIGYVPENRDIFPRLTVHQNLQLGQKGGAQGARWSFEDMYTLFPRLRERSTQLAGTLSGGERQMLAVGRALMAEPKLLMLDEPSLGLAPLVVREVFRTIERLRESGTSILLIEQNARAALEVSDFGYVLETGALALQGPAAELARDPRVIDTYLGARAA